MANIKSSKKRALLAAERNTVNSQNRARMRNKVRSCESAIINKEENNEVVLNDTISTIAKMAQKGILHKKTASRKISQLQRKHNVAFK